MASGQNADIEADSQALYWTWDALLSVITLERVIQAQV